MTETKHTPGPWRTNVFRKKCRVLAPNGAWLATAEHAPENNYEPGDISWSAAHANARLIAAAPEMLGALIAISERKSASIIGNPWQEIERLCALAEAAIAKATGGAP